MTFSDIRTAVFELLGEVETSPHSYTKAEIDRYINDSYRHIARETQVIEHQLFVDAVSGQAEYTIPNYIAEIQRVAFDNTRILPTTVHELDRYDTTWRDRTGTPWAYRIDQLNDKIGLYPAPSSSSGTPFSGGELGTVIDFGPNDSFDQEKGITIGVNETGSTHIFVDEKGDPLDVFTYTSEFGIAARVDDHTMSQETGLGVRIAGGTDDYVFDSEFGIPVRLEEGEYGVIIDYNDGVNNVEVWAIKDPDDMTRKDDMPELPRWTHQAIVFAAASRALMKESEVKNMPASEAYAEMAGIYTDHLKRVVHDRTPSKIKHMGSVERRPISRRHPRLPGEYPALFRS